MDRPFSLFFVLAFISVGWKGFGAEDPLVLCFRPEPNSGCAFAFALEQEIVQTLEGREETTRQAIETGYRYQVLSVTEVGVVRCRTTFEYVVFRQAGPTGRIVYDSRTESLPKERLPEVARGFAGLPGRSFEFLATAAGEILEVEGMKEVLESVLAEMDLPDGPHKDTMKASLEKQFGDASQKAFLEKLFAVYPQSPVAAGDSWEKRIESRDGFPIGLEHRWTLQSRENGVAEIAVESKLESLPDADPVQLGTLKVGYAITGSQFGRILIDEETGWPVSMALQQEFSGTAKAAGIAGRPDGFAWPVRSRTAMRLFVR